MTTSTAKKPVALLILDGWGYREDPRDNAIHHANTPFWDQLLKNRPYTLISSSGEDVGLPDGQMGNSEVGHMSLGSGRIIYQNISRIDRSIRDLSFFDNPAYTTAVDKAVNNGKAVHIFGLLSPGGVHSHEDHILAMVELAAKRGAKNVYVHAFLDGRDTPPRSAEDSLKRLDSKFTELGCGRIASLIGRYYAMDRDNRWERVEKAYELVTEAKAEFTAEDAISGLQAAYERDENDEFVNATVIRNSQQESAALNDGDSIVFMNFRADRAREITRAFTEADFDGFKRNKVVDLADFVTTTEYADTIESSIAFAPENVVNSFGEYMEKNNKTQLRIAETEKYAHVTFFFSGGREQLYQGEERELVASPDVATYDLQPEMSAPEVTEKMVAAIKGGKFDTIICNYANGDMVGHTGVFEAAVKAAEAIDHSLQQVIAAIEETGSDCLITADHGNCEQMLDYDSGQKHTQHTTGPVPFVYVGNQAKQLKSGGILADVAPTMLDLLGLEKPSEMTGKSLLER